MNERLITRTLGDLFKTAAGGTPLTSNRKYYDNGDVPWLMSGEVKQGVIRSAKTFITKLGLENSSAKIFPKNTVVVALYGATAGQVGILDIEAATNQAVLGIHPHNDFLPKYIFYLMLSRYDHLIAQAVGNAQPNLSGQKIKNVRVVIISLAQQQRLVAILDKAFDAIATAKANTEKNLQNARAIFESRLQSTFTLKGANWDKKRLEDVGITQTGSTPKTSTKTFFGTHISFIKPADFNKDGSLNYGNDGLSKLGLDEARSIPANSVLMVCIGATIGKCGFCDRDITTNQQINSLLLAKDVSHKFIYYQMITEDFQRRVILSSAQMTLPIINKSKWSALTIRLPKTFAEQQRVVKELDALAAETQRLASLYQQKLTALDALKKSLLHHAFTGQLTARRTADHLLLAEAQ